jgi:hypothetical protein
VFLSPECLAQESLDAVPESGFPDTTRNGKPNVERWPVDIIGDEVITPNRTGGAGAALRENIGKGSMPAECG